MKTLKTLTTILTLAALATLPALGDLTYLKRNYSYREKIPINRISSNMNNSHIGNLTDDNNSTEWTSWEEYVQTYTGYDDFADFMTKTGAGSAGYPITSEMEFKDEILTFSSYATHVENNNRVSDRGNRVLTASGLTLEHGKPYQVKLQLEASQSGELTMSLGGKTANAIVKGDNSNEEVIFDFGTFDQDISNAECKLDADLYNGSLNITNATLFEPSLIASSKEAVNGITHTFSTLGENEWWPNENKSINESGNLVATPPPGVRHFTVINGLFFSNPNEDGFTHEKYDITHDYRVTFRIKASTAGKVIVNLGTWGNGNVKISDEDDRRYLNLTTNWQDISVDFSSARMSLAGDNQPTTPWASIYCFDSDANKDFRGTIDIEWVKVLDITDKNNQIVIKETNYAEGFSSTNYGTGNAKAPTINQNNYLHSDETGTHFRILKDLNLVSGTSYKVILRLNSNETSETVTLNLGAYGNRNASNQQIGTFQINSEMKEYTIDFDSSYIPSEPMDFCSIYCPDIKGNITVESVEVHKQVVPEQAIAFNKNNLPAELSTVWTQFSIAGGLNLEPNKNYLVKIKAKSSTKRDFDFVIGSSVSSGEKYIENSEEKNKDSWSVQKKFENVTSEWKEISNIVTTSDMNDLSHHVMKIDEVRLQSGGYVGKLEIEWVKIYPVADNVSRAVTYAAGDTPDTTNEMQNVSLAPTTGSSTQYAATTNNGSSLSSTAERVNAKFYVFKDIDLPSGTYKLTANYATSGKGIVKVTFRTSNYSHSKNKDFGMGFFNKIENEEIGTITLSEDEETIKGDLIFEVLGENGASYNGNFDLKDVELTANNIKTLKWNYKGKKEFDYHPMSYKPIMGNDRMIYIPGWRRFKVMKNIGLKEKNKYKLIAKIKGEKTGKVTVKLGGISHDFNVSTEYQEQSYTFEFTEKPYDQFCEIIRPEGNDDPGRIWIDYIGFEDEVKKGTAFNEPGHNSLKDVTTIAPSQMQDDVLNVEISNDRNEVVLISDVTGLEANTLYGVTARVVYSGSPNFKIKLGEQQSNLTKDAEIVRVIKNDVSTGITEAEIRVEFPKDELKVTNTSVDNDGKEITTESVRGGSIVLNVSNISEQQTLQVKSVKLWNPSREFHSDEGFEVGDYVSGRTPGIDDEELYITTPPSWGEQFIVKNDLDFVVGANYTLKVKIKSSEDGTFSAKLGNWDKTIDVNGIAVTAGDEKEYTIEFNDNTQTNGFIIFSIGNSYSGKFEIGEMSLSYDNSHNYVDFSSMHIGDTPCLGLGDYPGPQIAETEVDFNNVTGIRLNASPYYKPFIVTNELSFNPRYEYTVTADVTPANSSGGPIKVMFANDDFSGAPISYDLKGGKESLTFGPFPAITANNGYLVFRPDVNYANPSWNVGGLTIENVHINYLVPEINNQPLATDYFDVKLDYTLDKDGRYSFHIGYDVEERVVVDEENNEVTKIVAVDETPTKFIIQGKRSDGTYINLGQYNVTPEVDDPDKRGHMFIDTYDSPLIVKDEYGAITELRFLCTGNVGNSKGIVQAADNDYAYGYLLRMNRLGVYKYSEFLNTESAFVNNWVVPMITRFQIESMGQRYAYPGPRLRDMINLNKTIDIAGDLFDGDPAFCSYWDTTLPYNKYPNVAAEGGQNRDYKEDRIVNQDGTVAEYNDFIDIILPQLTNKVLKYNGTQNNTNGKNQVVIVLKRGNGNINTDGLTDKHNSLFRYPGLANTDKFVDKGNGFPLEIKYAGINRDITASANTVRANSVDENVQILRLPNIGKGDSIAFALDFKPEWAGIRLYCMENTGQTERRYGTKGTDKFNEIDNITVGDPVAGTRIFRMSEIRAYMELPKVNMNDMTSRDDFVMLYNNRENFNNYGFNHTQGLIVNKNDDNPNADPDYDDINNPNFPSWGLDKYMKYGELDGKKKTWQDVINRYKTFFEAQKLAYPDFSYIEDPTNDEDVVPSFAGPEYEATGEKKRQRTYTVLHEVYALPGERVDLYPYSDIWNNQTGYNYEDQFVRWYDYLTDEAPSYLYFFSDPKSVIKTANKGYIGGKTLLDHGYRGRGSVGSIFFNNEIYDKAQTELIKNQTQGNNSYEDRYYYYDGERLRMKDQWVAADFSLTFNTNLEQRLGKDSNYKNTAANREITEPIVTFRHLFHIQSASVFADNYMADYKGNHDFFTSNRRYISTFYNKTFKIRLENAMPVEETTKSPYYYRKTKQPSTEGGNPEYEYLRVRGYEIFTYPYDTYKEEDYKLNGANAKGTDILSIHSINSVVEGRMFEPDNEPFMHINSDVETTVDAEKWLRDNKEFARSIQCHKADAKIGKYKVRIYGKDKDGNVIRLSDDDNNQWPLVIAEYDVEFLGDDNASFVADEEIPAINSKPDHPYYTHMERYLDRRYASTADVKTVNFDQYTILKKDGVDVGGGNTENFSRYNFFEVQTDKDKDGKITKTASRLKLPITWSHSNYGFGYTTGGDYNMFRLADHSSITPYKHAADARTGNPVDAEYGGTQTGTYDRLFYNTGGKEKGLFYYVNAASDPGEMVKIDFPTLCPGSTLYVSAWVNEFNDEQPETANVIFNFYANVKRTITKKTAETRAAEVVGVEMRTEQLHGFATGYVKRNPEDDYENGGNVGGDQGKWMHVYYNFVPDISHADLVNESVTENGVTTTINDEVDSYTLVLENNAVSSRGADYAIDDVRAYVVAPRVEAEQKGALCQKEDVDIDIEVRLPFDALKQSILNQEDSGNGVVNLQFSILDKVVYDNAKEAEYNRLKNLYDNATTDEDKKKYNPENNVADIEYVAFAASVLHYPHDNIASGINDTSVKDKPLSFGKIDFYPNYENQKDVKITVDEEEMSVYDYMKSHIKDEGGEKCFYFLTKPVAVAADGSEKYNEFNKTHHDYYIVVDNIGIQSAFNNVTDSNGNVIAVDYSGGKTNADVYPLLERKSDWPNYDKSLAKAYQWCSNCDRKAEFSLKGAAQVVVDGMLYDGGDQITCCENQRPVVQINLKNKKVTGKDTLGKNILDTDMSMVEDDATINPYLDWYAGKFEDFAAEHKTVTVMKNGNPVQKDTELWDVLDAFREDYPNADTWNVPVVGQKGEDGNLLTTGEKDSNGNPKTPQKYTSDMREWLKMLCTELDEKTGEPKLVLHQSSYIFPQSETKLDDGQLWKDIYATAIPTITPDEIKSQDQTYVICTQPKEVKITVTNTSPTMFNGFNGITYPTTMEDVPLRAGLKDLDFVAKGTNNNRLYVPLRNIDPATDDVTKFQIIKAQYDDDNNKVSDANDYVYLVDTNDPNYRQISNFVNTEIRDNTGNNQGTAQDDENNQENETDDETGGNNATTNAVTENTYVVETRIAGVVKRMDVEFSKDKNSGNVSVTGTPMAQIDFYEEETTPTAGNKFKEGITFREGYYYKFKFNFEEAESPSMSAAGYEEKCKGQTIFSIKVVPEYQVWTGDTSLNWNNDDNWRRVHSKDDLMASAANSLHGQDGKARYTTDGDNSNTHSYAPLNFTKVIIPAGATYPQLAARKHSYRSEGAPEGADSIQIDNGKESKYYIWTNNRPKAVTAAGSGKESVTVGASSNVSYQPTLYIQYDMAATTSTNNNNINVYCRPWYANACKEIHFDSNAEILNQQNLDYEKAWVDMEMAPHRWYNVASPLYGVVAGDMYLPSVGASTPGRQMTELFAPITYDNDNKGVNDRFAPAVYQRGWDKGTEKVRVLYDDDTTKTESVALASTWSHVYNDVTEEYAPGMGYSVKTDVTRLDNFKENAAENIKQSYVKFRFPKADDEYSYFSDSIQNAGEKNHRDLTRDKAGRLFEMSGTVQEVTLKKANDGKLFLVGNPFMAHLDMTKFLDGNSNIEPKYWLLTEENHTAVVLDHNKDLLLSTEDETITSGGFSVNNATSGQLPPMQGFFVQAKDGKTGTDANGNITLTITFKPDMMAVQPYADPDKKPILKAPAYGTRGDGEDIIRVSTEESTAIIRLSGSAQKGYAASEDVEMIDDSNQRNIRRVYTVAGTMASAINQTPDADGVEVGLMAPTDSVTVVTFNGLALEDYVLYDTATGEMTQLYDGFELEMTGSVSGRYFLTAGIDTAEIEDGTIRIMPVGNEVVVTAPAVCGKMTVRVFDTLGREVAKAEGFEQETRIALDPGIYAIEAVGEDAGRKSAKIRIKD